MKELNFEKGQLACVWRNANYIRDGRNEYDERNLSDTIIVSKGKKYVTISSGNKYNLSQTIHNDMLREADGYGHTSLFESKEKALQYFDKMQKAREVQSRLSYGSAYNLSYKAICDILEIIENELKENDNADKN